MRREMSQLQRWEGGGRDDNGTWKMWVAALHEQDTVSCLDDIVLSWIRRVCVEGIYGIIVTAYI